MSHGLSNTGFRLMAAEFRIRDWFSPRGPILEEAGIRPGFRVLDYGCGPGSYVEAAARMAGESGEVLALDRHPLAVDMVERLAAKRGLRNVRTIRSDGPTGLPDRSVDVVLLYDILHHLERRDDILREIHRVLKEGGVLSVSDHHLDEAAIVARVTAGGLFRVDKKKTHTVNFVRARS